MEFQIEFEFERLNINMLIVAIYRAFPFTPMLYSHKSMCGDPCEHKDTELQGKLHDLSTSP